MGICSVCNNNYDRSFEISINNKFFTFDCFECAIHKLAPNCYHCKCKIIGHGIESGDKFYCCAHCAREMGIKTAKDHID